MSAAATAAGYLYASGRLRGKGKEGDEAHKADRSQDRSLDRSHERPQERPQIRRKEIRVAALPDVNEYPQPQPKKERPPVKVAYRTRRWRPDGE